MDDPPRAKKKPRSQIGCLSFLDFLPLGPNPVPVLQLILYVLIVFFGLLTCIPMGIILRRFTGSCILYAQVVWDNKTIWPWAETSCDFEIYVNLAINVIFATLMILFLVLFLTPRYDAEYVREKKIRHLEKLTKYANNYFMVALNPMITVAHCVAWSFQLSGAIVLSVGFTRTCNWLEQALKEDGNSMSCAEASRNLDWSEYTIIRDEDEDGVKGRGFYAGLALASFSSWTLVVLWTLQLVLNFGYICNRCSCEKAEEKVKLKTSHIIASRRSRFQTPIGTPGGRHTPVPIGQSMAPYRPIGLGPAPPGPSQPYPQPQGYPQQPYPQPQGYPQQPYPQSQGYPQPPPGSYPLQQPRYPSGYSQSSEA